MHVAVTSDRKTAAENLCLYLPDKYIDWPAPRIAVSCKRAADSRWKVILRSETLAKDVFLSSGSAGLTPSFADNFFDLIPQRDREIAVDNVAVTDSIEPALTIMTVNGVLGQTQAPG